MAPYISFSFWQQALSETHKTNRKVGMLHVFPLGFSQQALCETQQSKRKVAKFVTLPTGSAREHSEPGMLLAWPGEASVDSFRCLPQVPRH